MNKFLILLVLFAAGCSDDSETDNGEAQNGKPDDVGLSQSEKEFNKGIDFANKGDHQTAISCFTEAIRLDPKNALAYSIRGIAYEEKGDSDKAKADFDMAKKLGFKPNNP